jgi:uncharacterized iron-regulated membrane protein
MLRKYHRWISISVVTIMLVVAVTGIILQIESMMNERGGPPGSRPVNTSGVVAENKPALTDERLAQVLATVLANVRKQAPDASIGLVQLRLMGGVPEVEVMTASPQPQRLRFDALTGAPIASDASSGGIDLHRLLLTIHNGEIIGLPGVWLSILCGAALVLLCGSGFMVYYNVYRSRARSGRHGLFWM